MGGKPPMIGPKTFFLLPKGLIRSSRNPGLEGGGSTAEEEVHWEPLYPHWEYILLQDLEFYAAHLRGSQYMGSVQR